MLFLDRARDVLLSVYLYNEKRGYTYLDELTKAFELRFPDETQILASIRKHARDERHHYSMFESYFRNNHRLPFRVGPWYGYCDQMVSWIFGKTIDQLDPMEVMRDDEKFFQLCRLIMITEMRGMKQVHLILQSPLVRGNRELEEIFTVIKKDEPSHCYPYQAWLRKHGKHEPIFHEKIADAMVHYSLMLVKIPILFFTISLPRKAWG